MPRPSALQTAFLALFAGQFVLADLVLRAAKGPWDAAPVAIGLAASVPLWGVLATLTRATVWRYPVAAVAAALLVCQSAFFVRYGYFLDRQILQVAVSQGREIWPVLRPALVWLALGTAGVTVLELRVLRAARQLQVRAHLVALGLVPVMVSVLVLPLRQGTADWRVLDSLGGLGEKPAEAHTVPVAVPALQSREARLPNVVLVLTESVRADSYCSSHVAECRTNPRVNALLPGRVGLSQMRSLASFTGLSLSTLITGRSQLGPASETGAMPTLFEYARAVKPAAGAGAGAGRPYTAFWSGHFAPVFGRKDLREHVDSFVTFEDLTSGSDSYENIDGRLLRYFEEHFHELPEPFFLVLHFYETHVPYYFDDADAPFSPWSRQVTWASLPGLFNAYRNAIYKQDQRIGAALAKLLGDRRADNTFVMFTSDHGDEFDEHHQIHHGQDLFDEQIRVPGWVHWGRDALAEGEARALRENASRFLTHLDVVPTVLDVYGVWDAFELEPHRRAMPGRSLLRPITAPMEPVPMSNCTETFPCPANAWGVLSEGRKLHATTWDDAWRCTEVGEGAEREIEGGDLRCLGLSTVSRRWFEKLPGGRGNW